MNSVNTTYFIQLISALVIGFVIHNYYRLYQRNYLRYWAYSFIALSIFLTTSFLLVVLNSSGLPYTHIGMYIIAAIKMNAGYLQIYWLFLGTYILYHPDHTNTKINRVMLGVVIITALVMVSLYAFDADAGWLRNSLRSGSRYTIGGIAFVLAAAALFRYPTRTSLGKRLVGWAFFLYGFELSFLGILNLRTWLGYDWNLLAQLVTLHGIFELLIYPVVAMGLVIWLLENERFKSQIIYEKLANASSYRQV